MDLSVVIVSWNTCGLLRKCLTTLKAELDSFGDSLKWEVFLVDNNSADGSADMARREHPWVKLTANDDNLGFAKANNQAFRQSTGNLVLLLNPDTEVQPGAIKTLLEFMDTHPNAAIVAP